MYIVKINFEYSLLFIRVINAYKTKYKITEKIFLSEQIPEEDRAVVFNEDSNMSEASLPDLEGPLVQNQSESFKNDSCSSYFQL